MCEPVTAGILIAGTVASGVMQANAANRAGSAGRTAAQSQAFQSIQAGFNEQQSLFAQAEVSEFRAETARANMDIAQRLSDDAIERGRFEEHKTRIGVRQFIGRQRVAQAAQGIVVDEGSALNLIKDTAGIGELSALLVRVNSAREAQGFLDQKFNFLREAELNDMGAEDLYEAGDLAYSSALGAAESYERAGRSVERAASAQATGILIQTGASVATQWAGANFGGAAAGSPTPLADVHAANIGTLGFT